MLVHVKHENSINPNLPTLADIPSGNEVDTYLSLLQPSYVGIVGCGLLILGPSSITRCFQVPRDSHATERAAAPKFPIVMPAQMPMAPNPKMK
jgi:hypothetical protein